MDRLFCAEQSLQSGLDIIGNADDHRLYIVIECPPPWAFRPFESRGIPETLRALQRELDAEYDRFETQFLLIHSEYERLEQGRRIMLFYKPQGLATAYKKQVYLVEELDAVAPLVGQYLRGEVVQAQHIDDCTRDFLVCTHGSRDRCCARFGKPIYHAARQIVAERALPNLRIWEASHIGGHRFAPTAIDFPEGRYYGYLDTESLADLLTRRDTSFLNHCYRGSGLLPWAVQILEKELFLSCGWDWMNHSMAGRILESNADESFNVVELTCRNPTGEIYRYTGEVIADLSQSCHLIESCHGEAPTEIVPYRLRNLTCERLPNP
ncbi:MAG TPA: sucrase ferredoxin [Stenomitos sp.]